MKKLMLLLMGMAVAALVHAADKEDSNSATEDHSKNPLTGTKTATKKWTSKKKTGHGKSESTKTETTKEKTDGSSEKKTETDTKSDSN